jgi:hypothetical protein
MVVMPYSGVERKATEDSYESEPDFSRDNSALTPAEFFTNEAILKLREYGVSEHEIARCKFSEDYINLIDKSIPSPSFEHYMAIQRIWWRDHAWGKPNLEDKDSVILSWIGSEQELAHHIEYTGRYVFNPNILLATPDQIDYAFARIEDLAKNCPNFFDEFNLQ